MKIENQISNILKSCFQIATKYLINSIKTSKMPLQSFLFFEKAFDIFRILIQVDKRTKKTRIIGHCVKTI
jgi:hypothetical protein